MINSFFIINHNKNIIFIMGKIIILMNCLGEEIQNYLENIPEVKNKYSIQNISTYTNLNNYGIASEITNCDVLITNNIKNYPALSFNNLKQWVKPGCKIIKIEFIRFKGFFPLDLIPTNNNVFVLDNSFIQSKKFENYINYPIDP